MTTDNIQQLIDRYFDGATTLAEEQMLYAYFASDDVAEAHLPLREMFRDMAAVSAPVSVSVPSTRSTTVHAPVPVGKPAALRRIWSAAAAIAAFVVLIAGISVDAHAQKMAYLDALYKGSYMIVNGKRIDDIGAIHRHLDSTLAVADDIEQEALNQPDVQQAVVDLLNSYSDPEAQRAIQKALNQ